MFTHFEFHNLCRFSEMAGAGFVAQSYSIHVLHSSSTNLFYDYNLFPSHSTPPNTTSVPLPYYSHEGIIYLLPDMTSIESRQ